MKSYHLDYVEFYITNYCNFNCSGCNRFNNYNFHGHHKWEDYKEQYRAWSKILDIPFIGILGGEPMSNPEYLTWVRGIHEFWPNAKIKFVTNGSLLFPKNRDFYDVVATSNGNICISIGLHNVDRRDEVVAKVKEWMRGEINESDHIDTENADFSLNLKWKQNYDAVRDPSWPDCKTIDEWVHLPEHIQQECIQQHNLDPQYYCSPSLMKQSQSGVNLVDSNGVKVIIRNENYFQQDTFMNDDGKFRLHNNDPIQSHNLCMSKNCHQLFRGRLYKCPQVTLWPEFSKQFDLDLTHNECQLIDRYQGADPNWPADQLDQFVSNIDQPIDQCRLCPDRYKFQIIKSQAQKVIFPSQKIRNNRE